MANSIGDIVNRGLVCIGHTQFVTDITTEQSDEAGIANLVYADCRDEVLRACPWPFATRRSAPAQLTATTLSLAAVPGGWTYAYAYPADCAYLRRLYALTRNPRTDNDPPFVIEDDASRGKVILTDESAPQLVYTARLEDISKYPPEFVTALAWRLAIEFAAGLRKDAKFIDKAWSAFNAAQWRAVATSKQESRGDITPDPAWIANR